MSGPLRIAVAGMNNYGECGVAPDQMGVVIFTPDGRLVLPEGSEVAEICCGQRFEILLTTQGHVLHAGCNVHGQQGCGPGDCMSHHELTRVPLQQPAVDVACGMGHVIVILEDESVYTWGLNEHGQCGRGSVSPKLCHDPGPVAAVEGLVDAERCFAGGQICMVITRGDQVFAWGWNEFGQLCLGSASKCECSPQRVPLLSKMPLVQVQLCHWHCIALRADGEVLAWGALSGQLADGSGNWSPKRGSVPIQLHWGCSRCVAAGHLHCGAVDAKGVLRLWGNGTSGELGLGQTNSHTPHEVRLPSGLDAEVVECGKAVSFVRDTAGTWFACGKGDKGLPFGSNEPVRTLTRIPDPQPSEVVCGSYAELALYISGSGAADVAEPSRCGLTVVQRNLLAAAAAASAAAVTCAAKATVEVMAPYETLYAAALLILLAQEVWLQIPFEAACAAAVAVGVVCDEALLAETSQQYEKSVPVLKALQGLRSMAAVALQRPGDLLPTDADCASPHFESTHPGFVSHASQPFQWGDTFSRAPSFFPRHRSNYSLDATFSGGESVLLGGDFDPDGGLDRMQDGALDAQGLDGSLSDFLATADGQMHWWRTLPESDVFRYVEIAADSLPELFGMPGYSRGLPLQLGDVAAVVDATAEKLLVFKAADDDGSDQDAVKVKDVPLPLPDLLRDVEILQMLRWARNFPARWKELMEQNQGKDEFHDVDVACRKQEHPNRRAGGRKPEFCCMQRSIPHVAGRMLKRMNEGKAHWAAGAISFAAASSPRDLQEGIAAAHIFSLEFIDPQKNKPRKAQLYAVLNAAMRKVWSERSAGSPDPTDASSRLQLFAPLIVHLHHFIDWMGPRNTGCQHSIVYRGIASVVAQGYEAASEFVWSCFSSTADKPNVAETFTAGVGTLFVLRERSAAVVSMCSMWPGEAERVIAPARFKVLARMPETTLCVAETRSDIVIAEEVAKGGADRDPSKEAAEGVELRLRAHQSSAFIFKTFAGRFVEPRVRVDGGESKLFKHFEGPGQAARVTLLRGDGGTGKTSVMLALLERMLRLRSNRDQDGTDCETPIFVHCPWAEGLLTEPEPRLSRSLGDSGGVRVGSLVRALCEALAITTDAELQHLQRKPLLVLLDSLDECSSEGSPSELLAQQPLLPRGGVEKRDWPRARFIICCRKEYLEGNGIEPQMLDEGPVAVCDIQPFTPEEQSTYIDKLTQQEVQTLERRLAKAKTEGDVQSALELMRCRPCSFAIAISLREMVRSYAKVMQLQKEARAADVLGSAGSTATVPAEEPALRALKVARGKAIEQCAKEVRELVKLLPSGLLSNPFVLFLACSASRQLGDGSSQRLSVAPRYRVYDAWVRLDGQDRVARAPELDKVMPPADDRQDRLLDAASRLAVGMFSQRHWQTTVGDAMGLLENCVDARAVLSVLPLRLESVQKPCCRVTWRHRTLQEFAVARALLLPERTPAKVWEQALKGPLQTTPEVVAFFHEGLQTLQVEDQCELQSSLRAAGAAVLLEGGVQHQEAPSPWQRAPSGAAAECAAELRRRLGELEALSRAQERELSQLREQSGAAARKAAQDLREKDTVIEKKNRALAAQDALIAAQERALSSRFPADPVSNGMPAAD